MRLCAIVLAVAGLSTSAFGGSADKKLDIFWIDTEGGASTLFVTPAGESLLIDTGNPAVDGKSRDAERIRRAADVAGLKKIDFLVTTHFHRDHFGGAAELAQRIPIGVVYDNGEFKGGRERPSAEYLAFKCDKRLVINPGDSLPLKNIDDAGAPKLTVTCIAARQQTMPPPADAKKTDFQNPRRKPDDFSDNANSIAQVIRFGTFAMFVGGDLTWNVEEKLVVPVNLIGKIDVYQSTHHGLDVSNNPLVVQASQPTVAVITNGPIKGCMPETFATITKSDSIVGIYQMHRNLRPNEEKNNVPDEFIANQKADCDGNDLRCSVAADAKTYVVTLPATKHEQRFETTEKK